jgi:aryl-alcohol dehydrogenase-like predicted oxidoreductase
MDERLEQALAVSKALETHQNQKNILHKQYKDNLIYYFDGQKISVDLSLIVQQKQCQ